MRLIVVGSGRVGSALASAMTLHGHTVCVIDRDPAALAHLGPGFSGEVIAAMALDKSALLAAGIERADALAAVTGSDEVNAVVSRVAIKRFRVPRVVARVYDPAKADIYRRLGVQTISPVAWGVSRLFELLSLVDVAHLLDLGSGQVGLVEAAVPATLDGRRIGDLEVPGEVRAVTITRSGHTFVPDSATHLHAEDIVALAVTSGSQWRLEAVGEGRS